MELSAEILNTLHYGYAHQDDKVKLPDAVMDAIHNIDGTHSEPPNIKRAEQLLTDVFADELSDVTDDATHVVLLSGGLDSRLILSMLLESVPAENVKTVTFGSPETWDYQIGPKVAQKAGVEHTLINTEPRSYRWSKEVLVEYASLLEHPNHVFTGYVLHDARSQYQPPGYEPRVVWSGYLGDVLGDAPKSYFNQEQTWQEACKATTKWERHTNNIDLTPSGYDPLDPLPDEPFVDKGLIRYGDQLNLATRQRSRIKPRSVHSDVIAPFENAEWIAFMLSLPIEARKNQRFHKRLVQGIDPDLFSLPTTTERGFPLDTNSLRLKVNYYTESLKYRIRRLYKEHTMLPGKDYFNLDMALRGDNSFRDVSREALNDFSKRDSFDWIDPHAIWGRHQQGENLSNAIETLSSLEFYLQAHEQR